MFGPTDGAVSQNCVRRSCPPGASKQQVSSTVVVLWQDRVGFWQNGAPVAIGAEVLVVEVVEVVELLVVTAVVVLVVEEVILLLATVVVVVLLLATVVAVVVGATVDVLDVADYSKFMSVHCRSGWNHVIHLRKDPELTVVVVVVAVDVAIQLHADEILETFSAHACEAKDGTAVAAVTAEAVKVPQKALASAIRFSARSPRRQLSALQVIAAVAGANKARKETR